MDCLSTFDALERVVGKNTEISSIKKNEIRFKKGETLVKQGVTVKHMMFVKSGIVKLEFETETGAVILDVVPADRMICMSGLFGDSVAKYSVIALSDTEIYDINREVIESLVKSDGNFAATVVQNLNNNNHHLYDRISSLNQKQMNGRVADVILYLANDVYKRDEFPLHLSRRDMGNFSGMAMMSVIRTIQSLKQDDIITEKDGEMTILNRKKLEQLSENG
ncbi:MAG: Crp/Fnr family transcriptional regulator [Bacteroidota bacterium]